MQVSAFDLSDETVGICRVYGHARLGTQMYLVASRHAQTLTSGQDVMVDLRTLVIEIDQCWDRETSPNAETLIASAAGQCRRLLLRLHAEETARLAIQGAKDAGVQQWKLQAMLSEIYGDTF
jgi:hypothetical protein